MKLSRKQKIRIARFMVMHPSVSHGDMADLFAVSRSTISGIWKQYGFTNTALWRDYVYDRFDKVFDADLKTAEEMFT